MREKLEVLRKIVTSKPAAVVFGVTALTACTTGERAVISPPQNTINTVPVTTTTAVKSQELSTGYDDGKLRDFKTTIHAYGNEIVVKCMLQPTKIEDGDTIYGRTVAVNPTARGESSLLTPLVFLATNQANVQNGMANTNDIHKGDQAFMLTDCIATQQIEGGIYDLVETSEGAGSVFFNTATNTYHCFPKPACLKAGI